MPVMARNGTESKKALPRLIGRFADPGPHEVKVAVVGVDDEHVVAFVKAIHRTYFNAVHIFAADAGIGNNISHLRNSPIGGGT